MTILLLYGAILSLASQIWLSQNILFRPAFYFLFLPPAIVALRNGESDKDRVSVFETTLAQQYVYESRQW